MYVKLTLLKWTNRLFGQYYRVVTISTLYITVSVIIIPRLKSNDNSNKPKSMTDVRTNAKVNAHNFIHNKTH